MVQKNRTKYVERTNTAPNGVVFVVRTVRYLASDSVRPRFSRGEDQINPVALKTRVPLTE